MNDNISRCHARIHIISNEASIEDTSGKAGIYVNGKKVIAANLKCGDTVMIMGYTILYMKRFLMIPETVFAINGLNTFSRFEEVKKSERNTMVEFERNPRIYKSLITDKIGIDPPPQKKEKKQQPFILTAGPSLTMSLAMMMQLGIAVSRMKETGNIASVASNGAMAVSLLAAAVLWPLLSRNYYQKQEKKEELYRRKKYVSYLEEKEELIKAYQHHNRWVWNTDYYPEISDMIKFVENKSRRLWEKSPTDQDFMSVRLGKGTRKSELQICVPERHFSLYDDDLLDLLYKIEDVNKELDDFPVVLSFLEQRITGVVGDQERIKKMIWCMIVNLVAMHSPDEVKIGFVGDQSQIGDFEWMIQLPHLWSDDGSIRFFVTKNEEANEMLRFFYDKSQETDAENAVPQYVIFVLNEKIIENSPLGINRWLKLNLKNMSFVYAAEYFSRIPKEAEAIILNDCERTGIYRKNQDNMIGQKVLGYRVEELIGRGSFATVYKVKKENESGTYVRALKRIIIPDEEQYRRIWNAMGHDKRKTDLYFQNVFEETMQEIQLMHAFTENVSIKNCKQLVISVYSHQGTAFYDGTYGLADIKVK